MSAQANSAWSLHTHLPPWLYNYLLELAHLLTEAKRLMLSQQMDDAHLRGFDRNLAEFVKRNPQLFEGYALLGGIEVILNRHAEAIPLLEKAAAMEGSPGSRAGIYRNLTISYAEVGRYQDAYDAGGTAISLSKTFFADPYFIYAVAKTDAGLGKFADAQTAIRVIAKKRPQVKDTKDFLSTVDFIFDKMKESDVDCLLYSSRLSGVDCYAVFDRALARLRALDQGELQSVRLLGTGRRKSLAVHSAGPV